MTQRILTQYIRQRHVQQNLRRVALTLPVDLE